MSACRAFLLFAAATVVFFLSDHRPVKAAEAELVSVKKIWDRGEHNAFTDLIRFHDKWYCTFREADGHVGGDGKLRVLESSDGEAWQPVGLIAEEGIDLRDPKLSITPDERLMIVAGGSVYRGTKTLQGRQPRVSFSSDGRKWTAPQRVLGEGDWLWRVTWHDGRAYGASYNAMGSQGGDWPLKLYSSSDGIRWELVTQLEVPDKPNETTLRFLPDGEMLALVRREAGDKHGWAGSSRPPYRQWKWHALPYRLGGPNFIQLPDGSLVAGSRLHEAGGAKTALARMTRDDYRPVLTLPSGGDTSYPGLVWHDGLLWISYYSSHEGKTSIYLAKIRLQPEAAADAKPVADKQRVLRAGAATSNITPFIGGLVVGGFAPFPSTNIHDELHARALVLDDGNTRLAIVVCDNLSIGREICDEAKALAEKTTHIPADHILISATHTHSGPSARGGYKPPSAADTSYRTFLVHRIADGIQRAVNHLEPARIGWGVGRVPSQVFNRRWRMKSLEDMANPFGGVDQVRMNPPAGSPKLLEPAGPTDPEVSFVSVQALDGRPIGLLANYSLHYVGGVRSGDISADYFAMFADCIRDRLNAQGQDPPFVGIMSNGTSGDINNINFRNPRGRQPAYQQMHRVADEVAAEVYRVHQQIEFRSWVPLGMTQRELTLAMRRPTEDLLERAKKLVAGELKPQHKLDVVYAQRTLDLLEAPPEVTIVLQALRIGELGIATSPFETFAETGLEIKRRSPWKPTFTIELANGGYGYLPTPEQHRLGGYETWLGTNRVEPQASRTMTEQLVSMLEELKRGDE